MARVRAEVHAHDEDTDDKSRGEEAAAVLERGEGEGAPPGRGKLEAVAPCVRGARGAPPPPDWPAGRPASSRPRSRPCSARSRRSRASSLRGQVASSSSWQADAWSASRSDLGRSAELTRLCSPKGTHRRLPGRFGRTGSGPERRGAVGLVADGRSDAARPGSPEPTGLGGETPSRDVANASGRNFTGGGRGGDPP